MRVLGLISAGALVLAAAGGYYFWRSELSHETDEIKPAPEKYELFQDDLIRDKHPEFIPDLVDARPLGDKGKEWQLNASAAVIGLDIKDTSRSLPARPRP